MTTERAQIEIKKSAGAWGTMKDTARRVLPPNVYLALREAKELAVDKFSGRFPYTHEKTVAGVTYKMNVGNRLEQREVEGSCAEDDVIAEMISVTQPGAIVLDIGAAIGTHAIPEAKHIGDSGRVYAFEPDKFVRQALQANLDLNGVTNTSIQSSALWDRDTDLVIHTAGRRSDAPQVTEVGDQQVGKHFKASARIPARSIDSLVLSGEIQIPQGAQIIAKVDVEGAGGHVLDGMTIIKPHYIFMEVHPLYGESLNAIKTKLDARGYTMTSIKERESQLHCIFELKQ